MFKINDKDFEIDKAFMDGLLDYEEEKALMLGLEISAKKVDNYTQPSISSETLLKIKEGEIKEWQDITGRIIEWEKYSKNIWKPHIKFYNWYKKTLRGNFIYNAKIEFKNIEDKIFVRIKGLCDSKYNGKEIRTLSLDIETEIEFTCIQIGPHETEETARNKLKLYLDHENFSYRVSKLNLNNLKSTDTGIDMGKFYFENYK
jgi:hypothetical protein